MIQINKYLEKSKIINTCIRNKEKSQGKSSDSIEIWKRKKKAQMINLINKVTYDRY